MIGIDKMGGAHRRAAAKSAATTCSENCDWLT